MAEISRLARLLNGMSRGIDLASNTLVVGDIKIGGGSGTTLNQTQLNSLLTLIGGNDISAALHHHDGRYYTETELDAGQLDNRYYTETELDAGQLDNRYFTETELQSTTDSDSGADKIGATAVRTQTTAQSIMEQLDTDLAAAESSLSGHLDGGASKHDASEIDVEGVYTNITGSTDLETTIASIDTDLGTKADDADVIKKDGSVAFTADQSMGGFKLTNLGAPVASSDAARLEDVQAAAAGQLPKAPVDLVSTSNITLSGEQTIDGVLTSTSRVLVAGQTNTDDNGIYVTAAGAWSRATDADGTPSSEIARGNTVLVLQGTGNANTVYILNATDAVDPAAIAAGTESQEWIIYSRAESTTASLGVTKVGLDFRLADAALSNGISVTSGAIAIGLDTDPGLEFNSNALRVKIKAASGLIRDADGLSVTLGDFSTTDLVEGTNQYFTEARVRATVLTGFTAGAGTVTAADSVLQAFQKLQGNFNDLDASQVGFSPAVLTDWNGDADPGQTDDALDQLAARTKTLEQAGGNESVIESMIAGEAMSANTLLCVRMAKGGETSGRVYLADKDATTNDDFHVIGMIYSTTAISAADPITVYKNGKFDLGAAHALDIGQVHFLGAAGAVINGGTNGANAPTTANEAAKPVCIARETNVIEVQIQQGYVN